MVANETIKKKGLRKLKLFMLIMLCMSILLTACTSEQADILFEILDILEEETTEGTNVIQTVDGEMQVHFIDVGQADATLFIQDGKTMLFDVGTKNSSDELEKYLKNLDIKYIDVLVLSHPHEDHMGGASVILNNFEVGTIYGPDIFDISSLDTKKWFNDMMDAVDRIDEKRNEGIAEEDQTSIWHFPRNEKGEFAKFKIGGAIVEFYAPLEDEYSDDNDYSICAKITFGEIDIMLTGDATKDVEEALIEEGEDLDVEIFQASHHGSDTGNSKEFLEEMTPECIVISCGMENRYNHPVKSVVEMFKQMNIPVYRTDESGDIVMTTDGTEYSFDKEPGTYTSGKEYKGE